MKNKDKMRELIAYLIFGVLTTAVGMGTYFVILWLGEHVWHISPETSIFNVVRVIAQILHWVFAVLFAFFTNKKWVFEVKGNEGEKLRMASFFGSRLFSLGCDSLVTFGVVFVLTAAKYKAFVLELPLGFSLNLTSDFWAKLAAAVVVIIVNYLLSKFLVFKKKKAE